MRPYSVRRQKKPPRGPVARDIKAGATLLLVLALAGAARGAEWGGPADPWPVDLPRVSTASVAYWGTFYQSGVGFNTNAHISLEVDDVMTASGEIQEWVYSHGGRVHSSDSGKTFVQFVSAIEAGKLTEVMGWIRTRGKVLEDRVVKSETAAVRRKEVEDRLNILDREFAENGSAWKRMPTAATFVGRVWGINKINNQRQLHEEKFADLSVRILKAGGLKP